MNAGIQHHRRKGTCDFARSDLRGTGSTGLIMVDTSFKTNASLIAKLAENYNEYKSGKITKGQYDSRRRGTVKDSNQILVQPTKC